MTTETDVSGDDGSFTPEERAQFDAMRKEPPAEAADERQPEAQGNEGEAEKASPEPAEGDGKADQREQSKFVPHGAFHEEREKRKAAEQKLSILEERTNGILRHLYGQPQQPQPQKEQPAPPPKPEDDLLGAFDHTNKTVAEIRQDIENFKRNLQQQDYANRLIAYGQSDFEAANAEDPDYEAEYRFVLGRKRQELAAYGCPPNELKGALNRWEMDLLHQSAQQRARPTQRIRSIAQALGYQKAPPPAEAEDEKLAKIEAGQAASKSLNGSGGKPTSGMIDAKQLAAMSDEEYAAFKAKNPRRHRQLLGME